MKPPKPFFSARKMVGQNHLSGANDYHLPKLFIVSVRLTSRNREGQHYTRVLTLIQCIKVRVTLSLLVNNLAAFNAHYAGVGARVV